MAVVEAWMYTGGYPHSLYKASITIEDNLAPTEVQLRVCAASLNPVDVQLMDWGIWSLPYLGYAKGIGFDFSGTILRAGSDSGYQEGDKVFGITTTLSQGVLAEVIKLDAKSLDVLLMKRPTTWTHEQAAATPLVFLTARTCIEYVDPYVGVSKVVAVLGGSSSTGMQVVRLAKQRGWTVISTCSKKNEDFVKGLGADQVIDYTTDNVPKQLQNASPEVIIDCVGGSDCVGIGRRYVTIVGDKTDRTTIAGTASYVTSPRMIMRWALGWLGFRQRYDCIVFDKKLEYMQEAATMNTSNMLIDSVYAFDDVPAALERLVSGRVRGKIILKVSG